MAKANPSVQILAVEGGPDNGNNENVFTMTWHPKCQDPGNKVAEIYVPQKSDFVNGRSVAIHQASVLGGGSSMNSLMYTQGCASDYDSWKMEGWDFDDLKLLFKKV